MDLHKLYNDNQDFKRYVDKYSANYNEGKPIPVEEALTHLIIKNIAEYYSSEPDDSKPKSINITSENGMKALF